MYFFIGTYYSWTFLLCLLLCVEEVVNNVTCTDLFKKPKYVGFFKRFPKHVWKCPAQWNLGKSIHKLEISGNENEVLGMGILKWIGPVDLIRLGRQASRSFEIRHHIMLVFVSRSAFVENLPCLSCWLTMPTECD